jgi:Sugar-transfer associated ATP-grasp
VGAVDSAERPNIATLSEGATTIDDRSGGQYDDDWWYYFKKSFRLYPGISNFRSGAFLSTYYSKLRDEQGPARLLLNALTWAGFQLWLPFRARRVASKYRLSSEWRKSALKIARESFADPNDIALFRIRSAEQMRHYIRRFEVAGVNRLINPKNWQPDCRLGNKISFHNICMEKGIPHPEIFATVRDGNVAVHKIPAFSDLVLKKAGGEGGRGFQFIDYDHADDSDGSKFVQQLAGIVGGHKGTWIVQRRLLPHPDLAPLAGKALLAARYITLINENGDAELVTAVLRFPGKSGAIVDNIKAGGLMAAIDVTTGVLGPGCEGRGVKEVEHHPLSGVAIEGFSIPFSAEAGALAKYAHQNHFSDYSRWPILAGGKWQALHDRGAKGATKRHWRNTLWRAGTMAH